MSKETVSTPTGEEVNNSQETAKEESAETATVESKEETIADAMKDESENKIPDSIPYNRFKEKVDENKALADRVAELERMAQDKATSEEDVSEEIEDIAAEHGVDAKVLEKLAARLTAQTQKTIEEKLAPLTAKERQQKQDQILESMYAKAIEANPDYADVANKEVIKQLALNPANANKTFSQLLSDTYGNVVTSPERKTMETTSPGKSDVIDKVDYNRAQTDPEYFANIMADPKLKQEYNEQMIKEVSRYM